MPITTIDLHFTGQASAIASYLIPHADGAILIDCGPSSTLRAVLENLAAHGLQPGDVTDVFLTHIHFDHGGAAGWWAQNGGHGGTCIHVHPVGAPHLVNPVKLLASATRIYGDRMDALWGEFLPVPEEKLILHEDGDVAEIGGLTVEVLNTPGHANHHFAYICANTLFTGDVGGVRIPAVPGSIRLPTPPPEFHLETWRATIERLQSIQAAEKFSRVAPTHFGQFDDAAWHLATIARKLDALDAWITEVLPHTSDPAEIRRQYRQWEHAQALADGLSDSEIATLLVANPSDMSADGVARYWKKYRVTNAFDNPLTPAGG
jgi:glyoxylase-like metal-dependent hydrolase (beta-lactamase superfamily II)